MSKPSRQRRLARDLKRNVIDFATARRDRIAHRPLTDAGAIKRQALRARLGHDGPEAA